MDRQTSVLTWHVVPLQTCQVPRDSLDEQGLKPRATLPSRSLYIGSAVRDRAQVAEQRQEHTRSRRHQRALGSLHQATQDVLSWSLAEGAPRRTHAALFRAFQEAYVLPTIGSRLLCVPTFQSVSPPGPVLTSNLSKWRPKAVV